MTKKQAVEFTDKLIGQVRNAPRTWRGAVMLTPESMIESLYYLRSKITEIEESR